MPNEEIIEQINQLERELNTKQEKLDELRSQIEPEVVEDHVLLDEKGDEVTLSELFGNQPTLTLIHNMGKSCSYCTMWADGFSGIYSHLKEKTSFVLASPDSPSVQQEVKKERDWTFPMVSTSDKNCTFTYDVGFRTDELVYPGVSVFVKQEDGTIVHTTNRVFGPGDNFGVLWHLLDLLPE